MPELGEADVDEGVVKSAGVNMWAGAKGLPKPPIRFSR
jgi:hypothetical protein